MFKFEHGFGLCVVLLGTFLLSACSTGLVPSAATPTPNPILSPEYFLQKYGANITTDLLPDGGQSASILTVNDQALVVTIGITAYPQGKVPQLISGEGGESLEIRKLGDQSIAYRSNVNQTGNDNNQSSLMLDFTKGNVQVHLSAFSIAGQEVNIDQLLPVAQEIESALPASLPLQPIAVGSTGQMNSFTFNEIFKDVVLGRQMAAASAELEATKVFSLQDKNYCLLFTLNKKPESLTLALFDEQQKRYIAKNSSIVNDDETRNMQATRCIDRAGLAVGHYDLSVWANQDFVAEYSFDVK